MKKRVIKRHLKALAAKVKKGAEAVGRGFKKGFISPFYTNILLTAVFFRVEIINAKMDAALLLFLEFKNQLAAGLSSVFLTLFMLGAETLDRVQKMFELFNA